MKSAGFPLLPSSSSSRWRRGLLLRSHTASDREKDLAKPIAMVFALARTGAGRLSWSSTSSPGRPASSSSASTAGSASFGISWKVGVDGISLFLVAMTALLFPVAMVGPTVVGNARAFMGWMLLLEAACMGTFLSMDLFLFFVMFEITLVPGYFLIAGWGGLRRNYAAMKFFIYTFAGSAFLFVGILALVLAHRPRQPRPATAST